MFDDIAAFDSGIDTIFDFILLRSLCTQIKVQDMVSCEFARWIPIEEGGKES